VRLGRLVLLECMMNIRNLNSHQRRILKYVLYMSGEWLSRTFYIFNKNTRVRAPKIILKSVPGA
jgi:hypothetical protein